MHTHCPNCWAAFYCFISRVHVCTICMALYRPLVKSLPSLSQSSPQSLLAEWELKDSPQVQAPACGLACYDFATCGRVQFLFLFYRGNLISWPPVSKSDALTSWPMTSDSRESWLALNRFLSVSVGSGRVGLSLGAWYGQLPGAGSLLQLCQKLAHGLCHCAGSIPQAIKPVSFQELPLSYLPSHCATPQMCNITKLFTSWN